MRNLDVYKRQVTVFANQKVWWRCSKGHEWNTLISTRSGGSGCPYCLSLIHIYIKAGLNYAMSLRNIVDAHEKGFDENMYPVSYTHLDVYKRQFGS